MLRIRQFKRAHYRFLRINKRTKHLVGIASMSDYVAEDDCSLCSHLWPSEREAFRANLDKQPLNEPVRNACLVAFGRNLGFPVRDDDSADH
jgi:hypothetical protein